MGTLLQPLATIPDFAGLRASRFSVAVGLGLAVLLAGCNPSGNKPKAEVKPTAPPRAVKTGLVSRQPLERTITVVGSLVARDQATLSAKVPGRLQSITVDLGTPVKQGQIIAQIERQDYELKLKQAQSLIAQARARVGLPLEGADDRVKMEDVSSVKQARAILDEMMKARDRIAKLTAQKILSQSELENAEAAYQVAVNKHLGAVEDVREQQALLSQRRVEVEIARQQLNDTAIVAPFDGVVQERRASAGEFLSIATPVVTLVRTDPLRLRVEVPERLAVGIRAGQRVRLTLEGDTNVYSGEITRLSPAITEQNRMLIAEADVANRGALRPGAFARVEIVVEERQPATVIPKEALLTFAGVEKVFLIVADKAVEKNVATGRRAAGWIEVAKELKPGDVVVLNPGNLQGGQTVIVEATPSAKDKAQPLTGP